MSNKQPDMSIEDMTNVNNKVKNRVTMSDEEMYEIALLDFIYDNAAPGTRMDALTKEQKERKQELEYIYLNSRSIEITVYKLYKRYRLYFDLIAYGLTKQEIFDMNHAERLTYLYLFEKKKFNHV